MQRAAQRLIISRQPSFMRLLPHHFLCFLSLLLVQGTNAFDCNQHADGQEIFTKSNTDHCIFVAKWGGFPITDWAKLQEACRYTDKDRIEGYALRLGVLSKANPSDVLEYIRHFKRIAITVGVTANGSLPLAFARDQQKIETLRNYFRWEDGTPVARELWRSNEPNNDRYQSQDYGSFHDHKLCDIELRETRHTHMLCELYPYKNSAKKAIPECAATNQFKINEPCYEKLPYRETTEDEASQLCARRHPVSSEMYDHGVKNFKCQYEAYAACRKDETLIFNKCYKFHNEKVWHQRRLGLVPLLEVDQAILHWPSGEKEDGQTGYNRINPAQLAFEKMITVDPLTTDEIEVPLEGRAAVILRTSDYLNTPVGLFDRVDKDYTSAFVCERQPDESDGSSFLATTVKTSFPYKANTHKGKTNEATLKKE